VHNRLAEQKSNHPSGLITGSSVGRAFTYNASHQLAGIVQLVESINPANQIDPNAIPSSAVGPILENRNYSADGHTKDVNPTKSNNENTGATVDQNRTYLYDASERLVEVKTANGNTVATYRYDPFGRRIRKTVLIPNTVITPQNPIAQKAGTTFFGFASEGMIAEFRDNGDFSVAYAYTPALASGSHATWQTSPIYKRDSPFVVSPSNLQNADQLHAFHTDHLGTPQALTAITESPFVVSPSNPQGAASIIGKTSWRASAESFGAVSIDQTIVNATNFTSGTATENNHRFPGQFFDAETGLAQNYMRDYLQAVGRYAQRDPLGLKAGRNSYAYVRALPLMKIDPFGLKAKDDRPWWKDLLDPWPDCDADDGSGPIPTKADCAAGLPGACDPVTRCSCQITCVKGKYQVCNAVPHPLLKYSCCYVSYVECKNECKECCEGKTPCKPPPPPPGAPPPPSVPPVDFTPPPIWPKPPCPPDACCP
jgi:RHS repeat-associated protein